MSQQVQIQVKYKSGSVARTAIAHELMESGDLLKLPSGQFIQLVGSSATGVREYEEVDAPKAKAVEVKDAEGAVVGSAVQQLFATVAFPAPGPSKPLIGDDGKPLPAPKVVKPPAPAAPVAK